MPVTERRSRRRWALRETILAAARKLIRDEGLGALTMRRVADAVDYAPASLYAHFESREALLAALCAEGFAALHGALEHAITGIREPRARLAALAQAYVRFALQNEPTYRLIFMQDTALTKGVFESIDDDEGGRALALIVAPLAELRAAGTLRRTADPRRLADLLWVTLHGIASLRLACPSVPETDDATLIATALATLVEGWRPRR